MDVATLVMQWCRNVTFSIEGHGVKMSKPLPVRIGLYASQLSHPEGGKNHLRVHIVRQVTLYVEVMTSDSTERL